MVEPALATVVTVSISDNTNSGSYTWSYTGTFVTDNKLNLPRNCRFIMFVLDMKSAAKYSFLGGQSPFPQLAFPWSTAGCILMTDTHDAPGVIGTPTLWAVPNGTPDRVPFLGGPQVTNTGDPVGGTGGH
jgi:hypothetical protein